jgi:hypothetical protein
LGLCLQTGEQVLRTMMEQDREQPCVPPRPDDRRGHARRPRILVPRLRARRVDGHELEFPSFAYAAHRDPLDTRTLEAIAVGVTTRKYHRALDPLPDGRPERAVSKSSVSRRFVALTSAQLATWLARPFGRPHRPRPHHRRAHFRDHVVLLALGVDWQGHKRRRPARLPDRLPEPGPAVDDEEDRLIEIEPAIAPRPSIATIRTSRRPRGCASQAVRRAAESATKRRDTALFETLVPATPPAGVEAALVLPRRHADGDCLERSRVERIVRRGEGEARQRELGAGHTARPQPVHRASVALAPLRNAPLSSSGAR